MSSPADHLQPYEIAAYVDGATSDVRARVERHLVECADCRAEVADVIRILRTRPRATRLRTWVPAAVAAMLLIWAGSSLLREPAFQRHRQVVASSAAAPLPITPVGRADSVHALVWTSVPLADRYLVRLFDGTGTVLLERETSDTSVALGTLALARDTPYYWKVDAYTGADRRVASDLAAFTLGRPRAP